MAITPQDLQLILIIPKSIEIAIFTILVVLLWKRLMAKPPEQRYILNKLFIFSFICWAIYMLCDVILYNLAAVPFLDVAGDVASEQTAISGYPSDYPEIAVSQVLRDIAMVSGFLMTYAYLASALVIKNGEMWTREHLFKKHILTVIFAILVIVLVSGDQIGVHKVGDEVWVKEKWGTIQGALSLLIIVVFLVVSALLFFLTVSKMGESDPAFRKRTMMIGLGILVMALGGIFWMVIGISNSISPYTNETQVVFQFIGHGIWTLSPILIFNGLK